MINIEFSEKCLLIDEIIKNNDIESLNHILLSLDVSDQLGLHSHLRLDSLKFISDHREQVTINDGALEHVIWLHYCNQEWTNQLLLEVIRDYKQKQRIALVSLIAGAIKKDKISLEQWNTINSSFTDNETTTQLFFWQIRRKLDQEINLTGTEIEKLIDFRGFTLLNQAFDKQLIDDSNASLFTEAKPGEKDKKHKANLYNRALNIKKIE